MSRHPAAGDRQRFVCTAQYTGRPASGRATIQAVPKARQFSRNRVPRRSQPLYTVDAQEARRVSWMRSNADTTSELNAAEQLRYVHFKRHRAPQKEAATRHTDRRLKDSCIWWEHGRTGAAQRGCLLTFVRTPFDSPRERRPLRCRPGRLRRSMASCYAD